MPPKQNRKQAKQLKEALQGLGLGAAFYELIDRAVRADWDTNEFINRLVKTPGFRQKFPGLVDKQGNIAEFLSGGERTPISSTSLGAAIKNYDAALKSYRDIAKVYGYGKVGLQQARSLIRNEVSPDELGRRLEAIRTVKLNPELKPFLEQAAKAAGLRFDGTEVFRLAAGTSSQKFYDVYETARIAGADLGFSTGQASQVAQRLGAPGQPGDINALIQQLRGHIDDIGPELESSGVSRGDLAAYLADPTGKEALGGKIAQALALKRSRGTYVAGTQPKQGPGGVKLGSDVRPAAYG